MWGWGGGVVTFFGASSTLLTFTLWFSLEAKFSLFFFLLQLVHPQAVVLQLHVSQNLGRQQVEVLQLHGKL